MESHSLLPICWNTLELEPAHEADSDQSFTREITSELHISDNLDDRLPLGASVEIEDIEVYVYHEGEVRYMRTGCCHNSSMEF
ncbi:hypothetical protein BsWGS_15685 [Bradybaena similaris]